MLCGCMGYAAFGDEAPGNLLTGFGFYEPFWLLDVANAAIVVHLVGAYQVYCQPLFAFVEKWAQQRWPKSRYVTGEVDVPLSLSGGRCYKLNLFRLTWRSAFVVATTVVSMLLPFFNDVVGLLGALGFWPLTVYFPVEMYIVQKKVPRWSTLWGVPAAAQPLLPRHHRRLRRRLRRRDHLRPQGLQAVRHHLLIDRWLHRKNMHRLIDD
uniref:Amino acid transporter transmembrane domain-containing protein n=1 Tax=Arundo donax TaxID=35708 RepID=A0A0A9CV38_ARUDO